MNDFEFVRALGTLFQEMANARSDDDYIVNPPQMDKLIQVGNFLQKMTKIQEGYLEPTLLSPREMHAGLTAHFIVFDLYGEHLTEFLQLMGYTSAFSFDATTDGICISCTIPNVFILKQKTEF